jgi:hypothetical protein
MAVPKVLSVVAPLVSPRDKKCSRVNLSWLISVFENFRAEAIIDLMDSAEG